MAPPRIIEVRLPEYTITSKPDYLAVGKKVDAAIASLPDGTYLLRAIGSGEHSGVSLEQLADIVVTTGTDKYDPERKAVAQEEFSGYDYDIQAGTLVIHDGQLQLTDEKIPTVFGDIVYHFYEHAPIDRGHPVRIDLLLIYDASQLRRARKRGARAQGVRRGLAQYLYTFKNPHDKRSALRAIVKILA